MTDPVRMAGVFDADYYRQNYPNYDRQNPARKLLFYRSLLERHLSPGGSPSIHDVGCAFGRFLATLPTTWRCFGSDPSEFAIAEARKACPAGTFQVGSAVEAVFSETFDAVTAFDVLEHVPEIDRVADAFKEQLAPRGIVLFVVPVYDGLSGPVIRRLDRDPTHVHKWPRQRWLDWADRHFERVEWLGLLRYYVPGLGYLHLPTRLGRRHTPAIAVLCRARREA